MPDPSLTRLGLRFGEGVVQGHELVNPAGGPGRSLLTDLFPTYLPVVCGFESIPVPDQTTFNATESAWFGLAKFVVGVPPIEQDCYLDYFATQLNPPETSAAGLNTVWGTTSGTGAAIVIGTNLPSVLGAWSSAPCAIPGLETGINVFADSVSRFAAVVTFPTGDFGDTAPNKPFLPIPLGKVAWRFRQGENIDIALIVRGTQVNNVSGSTKQVRGHALITARIGLTQTTQGFGI